MRESRRVTIKDIASHAGVSLSTVNKALDNKRGISATLRCQILEVADTLGYRRNKVAQSLRRKTVKVGVIIPVDWPGFQRPIEMGIRDELEELSDSNISGLYRYISRSTYSETGMAEMVEGLIHEKIDILIICPSYFCSFDSVLNRFDTAGIPVIMVGNILEYGKRLLEVSIDTEMCGVLAAEIARLFVPPDGSVAVFTGHTNTRLHREKVEAFLREAALLGLKLTGVDATYDDPQYAGYLVKQVTESHADLRCIYVATGNSLTICEHIVASGLTGRVRVIATEIDRDGATFMEAGVICASIYQVPYAQGRVAAKMMYAHISEGGIPRSVIRLPPQIVLKGNVKEFGEHS
ncbi:MAG: LacI family DNA-binding transcriptional regulator, partial [Spirochaetales bacterium]|nr:LacI family DNA-binding transcriptional regulator [Spirochaetales bacterium]